jgi:hypothetical protein
MDGGVPQLQEQTAAPVGFGGAIHGADDPARTQTRKPRRKITHLAARGDGRASRS